MNFTSAPFFLLLLSSFTVYSLVKNQAVRLVVLLVASYVFYFEWSYKYALLLVFSTVLDYTIGCFMWRSGNRKTAFLLLLMSIAGNLSVLFFFKYYNFFIDAFMVFSASIGLPISLPVANVLLPVGISFYTFQTMSYTIDLYRQKIEPCKSLLRFSVFVAFFPQLVAGPIERAANLLPQLEKLSANPSLLSLRNACMRIVWGLFKKLVVANSIALQTDYLFYAYDRLGAMGSIVGAISFALQIYFDFSAYSDIAIGTAALFGIKITENFRAPYLARSPREFWRRWHISLSTWFRDYLYIPLGGSMRGPWRLYANLFFVMAVVGLWHGANYNFLLWGVWHGMALIVNRVINKSGIAGLFGESARAAVGWVATTGIVLVGWLFFRTDSMPVIHDMLKNLLVWKPCTLPIAHMNLLCLWLFVLFLEHVSVERFYSSDSFQELVQSPSLQCTAFGFLVSANVVFFLRPESVNEAFIYFAF